MQQHLVLTQTLFETLPSGLLILGDGHQILLMNAKARKFLSLSSEVPYKHLEDLPEYLEPVRFLLARCVDQKEDVARAEVTFAPPKQKRDATLGYTLKSIYTEAGSCFFVFIFSDITQILNDRRSLDKIKDELFQAKKLASMGMMISSVAHELNNPLTGISMSSELTHRNLARLKKLIDTEENLENRDQILKTLELMAHETDKIILSANKASTLANDLRSYSKPMQVDLSMEMISQIVENLIQVLKTHPDFSKIHFIMAKPTQEEFILCDKMKLEQVFYNIIKNASDAMNGAGEITISFSESVNPLNKKEFVTSIGDHGPGMDPETTAQIFKPFFTTKEESGIGLGLSISNQIVERHGGLITVDTALGEGTTFHVTIPLFEEEEEIAIPEAIEGGLSS